MSAGHPAGIACRASPMSTAAICRMRDAMVHVEDRGYQFADGVYEVCEVRGGRLVDERRHIARLERSLGELRIATPMSPRGARLVMRETVRRNRVRDGIVYLQVTRGVARRDHAFPRRHAAELVVTARSIDRRRIGERAPPTASRSSPCRTTAGSASTSRRRPAAQRARQAGGARAGRVRGLVRRRDGLRHRGRLDQCLDRHRDGKVVTRPADHGILRGITRTVLFDAIEAQGLVSRSGLHARGGLAAREAFVTAASQIVMPVVRIDGRPIGDGKPGPARHARCGAHFIGHAEWA